MTELSLLAAAGVAVMQLACSGGVGLERADEPAADHADATESTDAAECFELPGTGAKSAQPALERKSRQHQGLTAQGKTSQGLSPQGFSPQGLTPQGFSPQGLTAQGSELQRGQFSLAALNGARFELSGEPLGLDRGVLVAEAPLLGAELDVTTADGRTLSVRVEEVVSRDELTYHRLSAFGLPVCANDELGVFLPGSWTLSGAHLPSARALTYSCEAGVIAKCVAWGYAPWEVDPSYHQTCTRLARADYCGDGRSWTRERTLVNIYDDLGVQVSEPSNTFSFEAAWGPDGAVCVNESRYQVSDTDGTPLLPPCWADLPRCDGFGETGFETAQIANDSAHVPIVACTE